jgi:hypothetical protein
VKVTVPILTAPAPQTRWQPSLRSPTHFAHFYSETLKESREQKKWRPLCREVPCSASPYFLYAKKVNLTKLTTKNQKHYIAKFLLLFPEKYMLRCLVSLIRLVSLL